MIEFLNYVPPEGSVGELLMMIIPKFFLGVFVLAGLWIILRWFKYLMEIL